jgi:translation initiation factor 2 subunit 3
VPVVSKDGDILESIPQPEVNIGTLGHVDNGKSTLVEALTGQWTARHSEELKRGITIRIGYADAAFYKCEKCGVYGNSETCSQCGSPATFLRAVSFVDSPGHHSLMVTMLSGAALMDGALLVLSATEPCPQAQDREHLAAAEITGIDNLIIVQNKIDVVEKSQIMQRYHEIQDFIESTVAEPAPIIPVSAQRGVNIDQVIEMIEKIIPTPPREFQKPPLMPILRSFDVNKPGTPADEILGGVIGGSISQGVFKVDDQIEIRPGVRVERGGKVLYEPLFTDIVSLHVGKHTVKKATCGGLIGVGTLLDPAQTKADSLVGNIIGKPENLPPVLNDLTIDVKLFERAIGTEELLKVDNIRRNEALVLNVGTAVTSGVVSASKRDIVDVALRRPICAGPDTQVAVSRRIGEGWRLIGFGKVV